LVTWILTLLLQVAAATSQQPQRTTFEGTVVDFSTGAALANVDIVLGPQIRMKTDSKGAFSLVDIPPARYYPVASHPDYLDSGYGSQPDSSMRGAPAELLLTAGQRAQWAVRMLRAATISGRVYDSNRAPVANASVSPRVVVPQNDGRSMLGSIQPGEGTGDINRVFVKTNENGDYRISGLPAGQYYIGAAPAAVTSARTAANNAAITYYPGFRSPDQAALVRVASGAEIQGIDIVLEPNSPLRVLGKITNPLAGIGKEGADYSYQFALVPRNARIFEPPGSATSTLPDFDPEPGSFELRNVSPGTYDLFVAYSARPTNPRIGFEYYVGRAVADVTDRDVTNAVVTIDPAVDVRGQFILDESAKTLLPDLSQIVVEMRPIDSLPISYAPRLDPFRRKGAEPDGTFVIPHATSGRYYLVVLPPNPFLNLYVAGARLGPRNILGVDFELDSRTPEPLVIEISGQAGRVAGEVTDRDSRPVARAEVVLIPPLEMRRENFAYKTTTTNAQGQFSIAGIRPGMYTAYAFVKIPTGAWVDAQYMSQHAASGVSVSVERGQSIRKDLKVIP